MLLSLHVKNFAIIDEIRVDLEKGFNVLSGETGAGKSILIGSLNAALGGKMTKEMIGSYADYALVELEFESDSPEIKRIFEENELIYEDGFVVISRRLSAGGRSVCRINGETVSATVLSKLASVLIDIHGQHDHQSLLHVSGQRRVLDRYSDDCRNALAEVSKAYHAYKAAADRLADAENKGRRSQRELELLEYEAEEIESAKLKIGEDENLEERFRVLSNTEKILEELNLALENLEDDSSSATGGIDMAGRCLGKISGLDSGIDSLSERMGVLSEELSDICSELRDYADNLSGSEEEFSEVSERLDLINRMKAKYGNTVEEINAYAVSCRKTLDEYSDFDSFIEGLKKESAEKEQALKKADEVLDKARRTAAGKLQKRISEALSELNFEHATFEITFNELGRYTEYGEREPEFLLAANLGEPLRKLGQVASGGELSRIMLAIKSAVAAENDIDALVFDEIDTGISGRTAQKVAEKIALIASRHQVICITHLPQLAAMADCHFLIEKEQEDGRTRTKIEKLDASGMQRELARMLGGAEITENVLASAKEMKELADKVKSEYRREK